MTPRVTFPPRVNNIACYMAPYMAEHLTIDKCLPQITINVKFAARNIILTILTNKPYEAGGLDLYVYLDYRYLYMYSC